MHQLTDLLLETMANREADMFVQCFREVVDENEDFDLTDEQYSEIRKIAYDCFIEEHTESSDALDERFYRLNADKKFSKIFTMLMNDINSENEEE